MSDLWDAIEGKQTDKTETSFYRVFMAFKSQRTKNVEIQATSPEDAIKKGFQFYPLAVRCLISLD